MHNLWPGSLLPLGCAAAPNPVHAKLRASAAHSSGSKLPRHSGDVFNA